MHKERKWDIECHAGKCKSTVARSEVLRKQVHSAKDHLKEMHKIKCLVSLLFILLSITTWLVNRNGDVASKRFTKRDYHDMQTYLHNMYQREVDIYKNWSVQEVEDIRASVTGMIEEIVYQAFRNQEFMYVPRDHVLNYLRAIGSMSEGTKNSSPDEFDFEVFFPYFSSSNIAIIWDYANKNCAKLKYLNESHKYPTNSSFRMIISNNTLTTNITATFQALVTSAFKTMYDNKFHTVADSGTLGIVTGESIYRHACVTFYFQWKTASNDRQPLAINVDCVPSIYISSSGNLKRVNPVTDNISNILGLEDNILSLPSEEIFTTGRLNETYQFCLSFVTEQLKILRFLTTLRPDIIECFKIVKSFNPHKSPISNTDIKFLLIYEILPVTTFSKDSMAVCVISLVEKILNLIRSKTCEQVLFPDLFYGYANPRRLFKCHRDTQLYNVSQTFEKSIQTSEELQLSSYMKNVSK